LKLIVKLFIYLKNILFSQAKYQVLEPGKIVVITAPSGSGKSTLVRRILSSFPQFAFSVSACTRAPRAGEVHGKDYYFFSEEEFQKLIEENAFAEWEMVYPGKYYGTLHAELGRIWQDGKIPIMDIDVRGALSIRRQYPHTTLTVFIKAPSLAILQTRLESRGTESAENIQIRLDKAVEELSFASQFDYIVVNDKLEEATSTLKNILTEFLQKP